MQMELNNTISLLLLSYLYYCVITHKYHSMETISAAFVTLLQHIFLLCIKSFFRLYRQNPGLVWLELFSLYLKELVSLCSPSLTDSCVRCAPEPTLKKEGEEGKGEKKWKCITSCMALLNLPCWTAVATYWSCLP